MVVWGVGLSGRVDALDDKYEKVETLETTVHTIDTRTEVMDNNIGHILKALDIQPNE